MFVLTCFINSLKAINRFVAQIYGVQGYDVFHTHFKYYCLFEFPVDNTIPGARLHRY